jgi:sterol desaturase/sphingolipid hydroxylase (fatty acid hydroxylase superfamily)
MVLEHFEHHNEKLLPRRDFYKRLALFGLLSGAIILVSLVIGMAGYMYLEGMGTVDAFLNAAMLMGGMGPVSAQNTDAGKIFAGCYAMYCGFVLIFSVAIFLTPVFHRVLHHFHLEAGK